MTRALSWGQCESLFEKLHDRELYPVLVGGQAVNLWADYLGTDDHSGFGAPVGSKDVDVLGDAEMARACATALNGAYAKVKATEAALNFSAVVTVEVEDGSVQIDFQGESRPNTREVIRKNAVELPVAWGTVHVMHPLHCVQSRVYNVLDIWVEGRKKYDNPHGLKQLLTALEVMKAFSRYMLIERGPKIVLRNYEEIFKFARSPLGTRIWASKHINVFSCVVPWVGLPDGFYEKRYPQMRACLADRY